MQEMFSKLSSYAALLGVIGAIGGGFMAWGEFNNRIAQLENQEFIVNETVDLSGIIKELESIKGDVKINDAAIKFIDAKIEELKAEFDNPLLQEKHMPYGKGTYGSKVGRPPKKDKKKKKKVKKMYGGRIKKNDGGSALKAPTNKGLASLPKEVRNKMGFMKKGGKVNG